jgi:prepilin-type N-terminal cleavage/methylation domain-containing protein
MTTHPDNTMIHNTPRRGFTIIELLVVVSIIGLLLALLVPAIGKARDSALQTQSLSNLRNLGAACANYGAAWSDRQLTLMYDDFAQHINSVNRDCGRVYFQRTGSCPPSLIIGFGGYSSTACGSGYGIWAFWTPCEASVGSWENVTYQFPFTMTDAWNDPGQDGFGLWRLPNIRNFNQYVGGKFYDRTFYAPKDKVQLDRAAPAFERGDDYTQICNIPDRWVTSTYGFSPAGMWNPETFSARNGCLNFGGRLPPGLFRSPAASGAKFPELKTRMIEIWWLQNKEGPEFNPKFAGNSTPYYFNQCINSAPCTLFYDGHISIAGAGDSMDGNAQVTVQNQESGRALQEPGLFCSRTLNNLPGPWGNYGGFFTGPDGQDGANFNYDTEVNTSYHVFTVDGIQGRDFLTVK